MKPPKTYYVFSGAYGACDGSDWLNAFTALPAALVVGAVYMVFNESTGDISIVDNREGKAHG